MGTRRIENGEAKEYVWESHREVRARIENFGKGLLNLGLQRQKALGFYAINRAEWVNYKKNHDNNNDTKNFIFILSCEFFSFNSII